MPSLIPIRGFDEPHRCGKIIFGQQLNINRCFFIHRFSLTNYEKQQAQNNQGKKVSRRETPKTPCGRSRDSPKKLSVTLGSFGEARRISFSCLAAPLRLQLRVGKFENPTQKNLKSFIVTG
jgi:hypothetical protein